MNKRERLKVAKLGEMRDARLYNDWLEFHAANPQIYELYCKCVDKVIARGDKKFYSTTIWEVLRGDLAEKAGPGGCRKLRARLPNKYCAYYARYWMEQHPEHPKFFKKRSRAIGPLTS
jgi:hypothetical protein